MKTIQNKEQSWKKKKTKKISNFIFIYFILFFIYLKLNYKAFKSILQLYKKIVEKTNEVLIDFSLFVRIKKRNIEWYYK